jgi:ubiquitin-activating enzyme E1
MDTIEKSNLSRQFLFRSGDIGSLKSEVAGRAAKAMNPDLNLRAMQDKVAPETEEVFDDAFWESLTGVCTALDNVQARRFVDSRCVYYRRPMVDSGTLGGQANAQVVIPGVTESYASTADPPEKSIPVCTLKNFPSAIEHCIQWARDAFEGVFTTQLQEVQQYIMNPEFIRQLDKEPGMKPAIIGNIVSTLRDVPKTFDNCIAFARLRFEEYFNNNIAQLLHNFPVDSVTPAGAPFWSGPKRPPTIILFDPSNELHVDFIEAAAQLRAYNFNIKLPRSLASSPRKSKFRRKPRFKSMWSTRRRTCQRGQPSRA